jgi:hypothetical protein
MLGDPLVHLGTLEVPGGKDVGIRCVGRIAEHEVNVVRTWEAQNEYGLESSIVVLGAS